jgi:hypothetical protein
VLDLALDVDLTEGRALCIFEELACLASEKSEPIFLLFKKMLAFVVVDKLRGIAVGLESEFFGDES